MKKILSALYTLSFFLVCINGNAQHNSNVLFTDSKGKSSIMLQNSSAVNINFSDASVNLGFLEKNTRDHFFWGLGASGKTSDGVRNLLANGKVAPGVTFNGVLGWKELFKKTFYDSWFTLQFGYEAHKYKIFDPTLAFAKQVRTEYFNTPTLNASFNIRFAENKIIGNNLLGISVGYQNNNNYGDLDQVTLQNTTVVTDTTIDGMPYTRTTQESSTISTGNYKTFSEMPLNVDFLWSPKGVNRIAFYHYYHASFGDGDSKHAVGTGIYLLEEGTAFSPLVGLSFEIKDLAKVNDGFAKSALINIIVGKTFNF